MTKIEVELQLTLSTATTAIFCLPRQLKAHSKAESESEYGTKGVLSIKIFLIKLILKLIMIILNFIMNSSFQVELVDTPSLLPATFPNTGVVYLDFLLNLRTPYF